MARASRLVDLSYEAWLEAFFAWKPINGRPGGHIWAAKDNTSTIVNTIHIHVNNTNTYISVKNALQIQWATITMFFLHRFQFKWRAVGHIWPHNSGMPTWHCQDQVEERWYPHLAKISSSMHARCIQYCAYHTGQAMLDISFALSNCQS